MPITVRITAGQDYELLIIKLHEFMNETQMIEHTPLPDLTVMQCYNQCFSSHKEITARVAKWLKKHNRNTIIPNCNTIATETTCLCDTGEIPDVIGWCYWTSILIEVKVSRSDFFADKRKKFRTVSNIGMGEFRYYCCPDNLINEHELPNDWGLIYCSRSGVIQVVKKAERVNANLRSERTILLSLIRRSV